MGVEVDQPGNDGGTVKVHGVRRELLRQHRAEAVAPDLEAAVMEVKIRPVHPGVAVKHSWLLSVGKATPCGAAFHG